MKGEVNPSAHTLSGLARQMSGCEACARLVGWRREAGAEPPARHAGETYWSRPVPGFGDPKARIVLLGLAPGAHGANRTGRPFTGDRAGIWLYEALHRAGLASAPRSVAAGDGLALRDAWITNAVRCVPPGNRPDPVERARCRPWLAAEFALLRRCQVIVALGGIAWDAALAALGDLDHDIPRPKPKFTHGARTEIGPLCLLGCYHPSPLNTNTGRLSAEMLDEILTTAIEESR